MNKLIDEIDIHCDSGRGFLDMMHCKLPFLLPFAVISLLLIVTWKAYCYAEIHYTFFRYSLISRGLPEILVDLPWRVDAGNPIPIVCIVKDADQHPIEILSITAKYRIEGSETQEKILLNQGISTQIEDYFWHRLFSIELPGAQTGNMEITVEVEFLKDGKKRMITSDNLPGLSHKPFNVFVSPCKLPTFDGWHCGDAHYHSDMTQSQVEFGAPVSVAAEMGKAQGLSWIATADHSYDLDRVIGHFFQHDPKLTRWQRMHEEANLVNSENAGMVIIPAEEVSCGNSKSRNIHLLAYNTPQFIPGSGDGVKRGLDKRPSLTLRQCLKRIGDLGGFAYAAHPECGNGFLGAIMLNRDHWRGPDYEQGGYVGLQFWNGMADKYFHKGYARWIRLLLEGRKLYVLGGNDAHGDFNRCRKIKYPNTKLNETHDHVFGKIKTYAYCGGELTAAAILDALRNGRTFVTSGPAAILQARNDAGEVAGMGESIAGREITVTIETRSSDEFGPIDQIRLYRGDLAEKREITEKKFVPEKGNTEHVLTHTVQNSGKGYLRVEATSSAGGNQYLCMTNPIWTCSA